MHVLSGNTLRLCCACVVDLLDNVGWTVVELVSKNIDSAITSELCCLVKLRKPDQIILSGPSKL